MQVGFPNASWVRFTLSSDSYRYEISHPDRLDCLGLFANSEAISGFSCGVGTAPQALFLGGGARTNFLGSFEGRDAAPSVGLEGGGCLPLFGAGSGSFCPRTQTFLSSAMVVLVVGQQVWMAQERLPLCFPRKRKRSFVLRLGRGVSDTSKLPRGSNDFSNLVMVSDWFCLQCSLVFCTKFGKMSWRKVETTGEIPQQRANHSSAILEHESKNVSLSIVQSLLEAFPESAAAETSHGLRPLHLACRNKQCRVSVLKGTSAPLTQ